MREHGTMDFDFRKRCVTDVMEMGLVGGVPVTKFTYQVITYGLTGDEHGHAQDLQSPWVEGRYDPMARRPGRPVEMEYGKQKFFFNKRIEVGDTIPYASGPNRGKVQVGAGGIDGAKEAELKEWRDRDGGGDATDTEEVTA